jgi:hypothetical protein
MPRAPHESLVNGTDQYVKDFAAAVSNATEKFVAGFWSPKENNVRSYPVGWLPVVAFLVLACPASAGPPFWRLDTRSEEELRAELARVPEAKPVAVELPNPRGSQMALLPTQSIKGLPFVRDGRAQLGKSD